MGQMENTSQIAKEFAEEMEKKNRKEKITNWMPVGKIGRASCRDRVSLCV